MTDALVHAMAALTGACSKPFKKFPTLKEADIMVMQEALRRTNNTLSAAALILGISRQALGKRLQRSKDL